MKWLAISLLLVLCPSPAAADKADALFAKGKDQLAKKQYAEACITFEKVDEIDPGIGAKLNVAKCYQEWGKLVRAHKWYVDAEKMASSTGDKRAPKIKEIIEKLEPEVPRLTIRVPAGVDVQAAEITLDGAPFSGVGTQTRVEPGPHVITYLSNGEKQTKTIAIERGGSREVTLEASRGGTTTTSSSKQPIKRAASSPDPGRTRRLVSYGLMAAGGISFGVASYLTLDARSDYRSALDDHCMGAKDMCDDEGLRITHDARGRANVATVFTLASVALVAGGVVLYLSTPRPSRAEGRNDEALYLTPALGDRAGFLVLGGRY